MYRNLVLQRATTRSRVSRWYWQRRARGVCVRCALPTPFWRCLTCRLQMVEREAIRVQAQAQGKS